MKLSPALVRISAISLLPLWVINSINAEPQSTRTAENPAGLREDCTQDSDCVPVVEVWSSCHHYCGTYKYDGPCAPPMFLCPSYNKATKGPILVDCAANVPCRKPIRSVCENSRCVSKDY